MLKVSRSGFYAWLNRRHQDDAWARLRCDIQRIWIESNRVFGARSIHALLPDEFNGATLYRIRRIMREQKMQGCHPRASKRTTMADPKAQSRPDLIKRNFTSPVPTYKLVGDITYLKTAQGWLYLSTVIDLNVRMAVGWSLAAHMTADIVASALDMAKKRGYIADNSIFHSARGSQHTSRLVVEWACANNVRLSVGRTGSCHDNAVAESLCASLKNEMYHREKFATRMQAKHAVIQYVEAFCNRCRPHSSIDYEIPAMRMEAFFKRTAESNIAGLSLAA